MKANSCSLFLNFDIPMDLGLIKCETNHQIILYENEGNGEVGIEIELTEITGIVFNGKLMSPMPYDEYREFRTKLLSLGIDINDMVEKKAKKIFNNKFKEKYKSIFQSTLKSM